MYPKRNSSKSRSKRIHRNKYPKSTKSQEKTIRGEIILSLTNRITHIRECDEKQMTTKVINVSYEVLYNNEWITIVHYDSEHGYLHRHRLLTLDKNSDVVEPGFKITRGNAHRWFSWALKDLTKNYSYYRRSFFKANKLIDNVF